MGTSPSQAHLACAPTSVACTHLHYHSLKMEMRQTSCLAMSCRIAKASPMVATLMSLVGDAAESISAASMFFSMSSTEAGRDPASSRLLMALSKKVLMSSAETCKTPRAGSLAAPGKIHFFKKHFICMPNKW